VSAVVADTHALIWYLDAPDSLSAGAVSALDGATEAGEPIFVSAISLVEILYLVEKGRLPRIVLETVEAHLDIPNPAIVAISIDLMVARSLRRIPRSLVPDMPDRVIAATALHLGLPLITRDSKIRASGVSTIW
jgi:PIN domain nuclease of toxin-antitoxin system